MITNINSKEQFNTTGNCWDVVITWDYNGAPNKVIAGYQSQIAKDTLKALIDAQCNDKIKLTTLKYRSR